MDKTKVQSFINSYADAVSKIDIQTIASHFHHHFVLSTQNDYWSITNNDEFKFNLAKAFEGYKALGMQVCKLIKFEIINFTSNHCLVNIEWGLFDNQSKQFVSFDISYCIKSIANELKYVFVIAHNEIERLKEYQAIFTQKTI